MIACGKRWRRTFQRAFAFFDFHAEDKTIRDAVNVPNLCIREDVTFEIFDDLMDLYVGHAVFSIDHFKPFTSGSNSFH